MIFERLSAPGASALSVWVLKGEVTSMLLALGVPALPDLESSRVFVLRSTQGVPLDQGLLWLREEGESPEVEVHLHGGYGVAASFRKHLEGLEWREVRSHDAPSPLQRSVAPRNAWAHSGEGFADELARLDGLPTTQRCQEAEALLVWAEVLLRPPQVVLVGPPNVGKSTLFNAWVREERTTVSSHPGTTRDAIEAGVLIGEGLHQFEINLVDTAGRGSTQEDVDLRAQTQSILQQEQAWRCLWVLDASAEPSPEWLTQLAELKDPWVLLHRDDLGRGWTPPTAWRKGSAVHQPLELVKGLEEDLLASLPPLPPLERCLPKTEQERREVQRRAFA